MQVTKLNDSGTNHTGLMRISKLTYRYRTEMKLLREAAIV